MPLNIVPLLIKGGIHTYAFLTNLLTMAGPDSDIFTSLISSNVRCTVSLFVNSHFKFSQSSKQPLNSRFSVTGVGLNKAGKRVQHESLAVWVSDKDTDIKYLFIIERQPSAHSRAARFSNFSSFAPSKHVIESIQKAISHMRTVTATVLVSDSESSTSIDAELVPLIPISSGPTSGPDAPNPPQTFTSPKPLIDSLTTALAGAVAATSNISRSISPQSLADDSISGCPLEDLRPDETIRKFEPVELFLFDVALLAKVVHDYAPMYGLFENQCYMFASVMFDAIVQLYSLPASAINPAASSSTSPAGVPAPTCEIGTPKNANILIVPTPDQSGRWSGLLIVDPIVKWTIVEIVISRFREEKKSYMEGIFA